MSLEAKVIFVVCVLAFFIPFSAVIVRRIVRGQPFKKKGTGMIMPPTGPSVGDIGGP